MKPKLPRVPLPRQHGGAHRVKRELSAREELMFELNAMEAKFPDLNEEEENFYDSLIDQLDNRYGGDF